MLLLLTAWEILLQLFTGLLPEVHIVNSSTFSESSPAMHPQPGNKNLTSLLQLDADHLEDQALNHGGEGKKTGRDRRVTEPSLLHAAQGPEPSLAGPPFSRPHLCLRQQPASCSILNHSNTLPAGWQNSTSLSQLDRESPNPQTTTWLQCYLFSHSLSGRHHHLVKLDLSVW